MVELLGGPFDGQTLNVSETAPVVRMPMMHQISVIDDFPALTSRLDIAVYQRVGKGRFLFDGMETL